jgi:hypothetical protein
MPVIGNTGSRLDYIYNLHTWRYILTKLGITGCERGARARARVYVCVCVYMCVCARAACRRILVYWSRVVGRPPFPFSPPPFPTRSVSSRPVPPYSSLLVPLYLVPYTAPLHPEPTPSLSLSRSGTLIVEASRSSPRCRKSSIVPIYIFLCANRLDNAFILSLFICRCIFSRIFSLRIGAITIYPPLLLVTAIEFFRWFYNAPIRYRAPSSLAEAKVTRLATRIMMKILYLTLRHVCVCGCA